VRISSLSSMPDAFSLHARTSFSSGKVRIAPPSDGASLIHDTIDNQLAVRW
jgi:hypothetical protein